MDLRKSAQNYRKDPLTGLLLLQQDFLSQLETYKHKSEIKPRKYNRMHVHDAPAKEMGLL